MGNTKKSATYFKEINWSNNKKDFTLKYIKERTPSNKGIFGVIPQFFAPYLSKLFLYLPITANQISIFSFAFLFIPLSLIAFGNYKLVLIGAILLQISLLSDYIDGTIARMKKTASKLNEYYTSFYHRFFPIMLIVALSINSYRFFNNPILIMIGSITAIAMFLTDDSRLAKDNIVLDYQMKTNKRIKSIPKWSLLDIGTVNQLQTASLLAKPNKFKFITNFIFLFNSCSNLNGIIFLLAVFNLIPYAIIFYAPFYILIALVKIPIELKRGMSKFKFE